jgi:glycosyltransferase involved in cell wall biosynthesis
MRAGLPAIATRVGGIPETIVDGTTGLLVREADIEGLGQAMAALCHDPGGRARMSRAARNLLEAQFSAERMIARYRELYLSRRQRKPAQMGLDVR